LDCDNAGYVTRIWRLEDGNGNFTDHQQIIYIEPTPRVTGTISDDIICNNTPVTYTVTTPTTAIHSVRFDVQVINPHPEVTGVNNRTGLVDSDTITETPSNSGVSPKMIMYIVTPYAITSEGDYKCAGVNDTMKLWINPTPIVIPVNVNPICSGGLTDINLVTPTEMTSGKINFDFFVSNTGNIDGDTSDGEDLVHGDKISRSFFNNSDTIQSVNFWIIASNDDLGCIGDTTLAEVKVHALPLQDLIITKPLTCEGGSDATLTAYFSKGATPLSVNWIGPSGYEENYTINDSIQEVSGLEGGGVYRVTVTDNLSCRNSLDAAPVGAIFDTHFYLREKASGYGTTCPGSDDGEIWITQRGGSSGIPPFNYWIAYNDETTIFSGSLSSIGVTDTLKNLRPGRYKLYLHDANGCFDISYPEINVVDPPPIEISFRIDRNITCKNYSDGSVSASVTGGVSEYSYLWYRPPYDPPLEITDNEASLNGISAGKYYLRIIDQMGCIKTDSITIDEPEGMMLVGYELSMSNHPPFHISCNGASDGYIKLSVEGGSGEYSYLWTGPDGFTATTRDIFNLKAGIYDCTVTDIGGCELMPHPHFELVEPDILSITAVSPLFGAGPYNIGCFGETGSIDVTVTGGTNGFYHYEWTTSDGSGLVTDEGNQEHVSAGIYTVVVTDLNGCTDTTTVTLTQPEEIILELIPTHITCQSETFDNGSINLVLSGGVEPYSYEWSDEEGPIPGGILQDIFDLTPGTYTVMVTDANGCRASGSVEITLPPDLEYEKRISEYGDYQISCFGRSDGFIQIIPTGGREPYVFNWQMPDGSVSASNELAGLTAGEYILYITDSNMCSARDTIRLEEPGKLTMNVTVSDQICSNDYTGSIAVEAVNNTGPVDYLWADGVIGNYREGLSAGSYRVIITDSNNCNADTTIFISEAEPIKLLFSVIQPECTDMPDGSVTVTASGGTGPGTYSYLWSDGSTSQRINTVVSGWYSVTVADINGCYVRDSVYVAPKKEVCLNIPNAISPNGDGINDEWNIGFKELYPLMEVKIFNRWGELLWASEKGYPIPWDGRSRGAVLPVDSYHYTIDLHNGSKLIIGHITIVK
jgi:gliding motility-associated-like protein